MTIWLDAAAVLAAGALAADATTGATPQQPPMNSFNDAYYVCTGTAFAVSYDSDTPTKAKITTSNGNKEFDLKRTPSPTGVAFAEGAVKFWTDGKTVTVAGTPSKFQGCKLKAN
ncbi:MliC family protein [Phenylobacterium sp.]|jgi:membrane-bound inhibitor of C-type lysozyme|uniref:MliC family protein n=1 Tax=Phenylobacterium sp. TaxID=1871053 RepID=UPI002F400894